MSSKERNQTIDMVSKGSRTVNAALTSKYTDYCTVNEIEAETVSGISITDENNNIVEENVINALDEIKRFWCFGLLYILVY